MNSICHKTFIRWSLFNEKSSFNRLNGYRFYFYYTKLLEQESSSFIDLSRFNRMYCFEVENTLIYMNTKISFPKQNSPSPISLLSSPHGYKGAQEQFGFQKIHNSLISLEIESLGFDKDALHIHKLFLDSVESSIRRFSKFSQNVSTDNFVSNSGNFGSKIKLSHNFFKSNSIL